MIEHIIEWNRHFQAKKWAKQNTSFISSWHAYVGYTAQLFDRFSQGGTIAHIAERYGLDPLLLQQWADVGVEVGHLHKTGDIYMTSSIMRQYASSESNESIGHWLEEMMEIHIPTLLRFPDLLTASSNSTHTYSQSLSTSFSSLLETLAYPKILQWVRRQGAKTILDIGCGRATYLKKLAKRDRRLKLIGIEQNRSLIGKSLKGTRRQYHGRIELVQGDFRSWKGPKEPVDLVMLNNVLHQVKPRDRKWMLEKVSGFLAGDGSVSIITPLHAASGGKIFSDAFNSLTPAQQKPFPIPTREELTDLAHVSGLNIVSQIPIHPESHWYFITLES
ncbi:class I SAM-dependent methyltransferase [Paenibacillus sepulcri]|uniref:Class I SAM-dependent methyltransferase n=1 Tax=Paenibacillus sepulcri TaxID=359917 RepID=A0ABS7C557_9BACL|nr:class I SAM-dependent methyltransferase [Paenibacillus sepulcri]